MIGHKTGAGCKGIQESWVLFLPLQLVCSVTWGTRTKMYSHRHFLNLVHLGTVFQGPGFLLCSEARRHHSWVGLPTSLWNGLGAIQLPLGHCTHAGVLQGSLLVL